MLVRLWNKWKFHILVVGRQSGIATLQAVYQFLVKLNIQFPLDIVISLCSYSREIKTHVQNQSCIWIFIATLYVTDQSWKQLKYPKTSEQLNQVLYIHIIKCYSWIKRNKLLIHATVWKNLKSICKGKEAIQRRLYTV